MSDKSTGESAVSENTTGGGASAESGNAPSLLGSLWGTETSQKAWGWWESVKNNPTLQTRLHEANERLAQAQQQAHTAWENYDAEALRGKLAQLGKSATEYIDEADRKLEAFENGTVHFLQERSTKIVEKVRDAAAPGEADGREEPAEVLFTGPENTTTSRLDAELMALHASPDRFLETPSTKGPPADPIPNDRRQKLLRDSGDLSDTYKFLVPAKLTEAEFWDRYARLSATLISQDKRRKQLIESQAPSQGTEANDILDDWGSSEDEDDKTVPASAAKPSAKPKSIQEEGSDDDWE